MATTPTVLPDLLTALKNGLDIKITALPGEAAFIALLNFASSERATMDPDIRKRFDTVVVQQYEDLQSIWRNIWVAMGVLK